jgi:hypothetical protein
MSEIGWEMSAKVGATGQRFEIRTVADFLTVPEDRRFVCLREFHAWLTMGEGIAALLGIAGDTLGASVNAVFKSDVFVWIDDGKATAHASIEAKERA